jgi:hypothetical protein
MANMSANVSYTTTSSAATVSAYPGTAATRYPNNIPYPSTTTSYPSTTPSYPQVPPPYSQAYSNPINKY